MIQICLRTAIVGQAFLFVVMADTASASVVAFDNFAADGSYQLTGNWQGSASNIEVMLAQRFQPSIGGQVDSLGLGMTFNATSGNVDELTLSIVPDVDGKPGSSAHWQATFADIVPTAHGSISIYAFADGPTLQTDKKYWVTSMSSSAGFRPHTWWASITANTEPRGILYLRGGGGFVENVWSVTAPSDTVHSQSLRVTVVPEPTTGAVVILLGFVALPHRTRVRRAFQ